MTQKPYIFMGMEEHMYKIARVVDGILYCLLSSKQAALPSALVKFPVCISAVQRTHGKVDFLLGIQ